MAMEYTDHDDNLRRSGIVLQLVSSPIKFQFPPRVLTDSRKGSWEERDYRGTEPIAVFKTSGAREISLSWLYMVDGDPWTAKVIATQVRIIRGYYAQIRSGGSDRAKLVVRLLIWGIGGAKSMTGRILGIDVKHSDTIVGKGANAYPLRTDISIDFRIWTQGALSTGKGVGDEEKVQAISQLEEKEQPDWY